MSDSEGEERDQTQFNSREVRHHQADKGDNSLSQGFEKEVVPRMLQGATSTGHNSVDDWNRSRHVRESRLGSRSGRSR